MDIRAKTRHLWDLGLLLIILVVAYKATTESCTRICVCVEPTPQISILLSLLFYLRHLYRAEPSYILVIYS